MMKKTLWAVFALLITTLLYTVLLYKAEKIDRSIVFDNIKSAYDNHDLVINPFPPSGGLASRDNLAGIDQLVESFYALMVMYRDKEHRLMNALNPGFYKTVDENVASTIQAKTCAFAERKTLDDPAMWTVGHKPRFWHGVKALLLFGFKYLTLSQIHWMIKISTFFAFSLIAAQVMSINQKVGLAYMVFSLSAFYCSSILFFGGVAYSVPLLSVAVWGVLWLGFRMLPCREKRTIEIFIITCGGTILSFFYQLGGSEIYAMSLIVFVEIFLPVDGMALRNLRKVFESWSFFLLGFFGSIVLKHLMIVVLTGSFDVLAEFINKIIYRTSNTNDYGTKIGFIDIVEAQFHWYGIAAYGIEAIFQFVNISKYIAVFLVGMTSGWLAVLKICRQKVEFEELLVAFCGFLLMLGVVVGRYMLLRNHSDIHVFFVDRYLFVFAGTVYFFLLWLVISARRFLPKRP